MPSPSVPRSKPIFPKRPRKKSHTPVKSFPAQFREGSNSDGFTKQRMTTAVTIRTGIRTGATITQKDMNSLKRYFHGSQIIACNSLLTCR